MVNRPQDEPTPASKTILLYKVADHTRRFFEHIHSSKRLDYANCLEADRALRSVILDGPSYLKADTGVEGHPPWAAWFRNYWVISISRAFRSPAQRVFSTYFLRLPQISSSSSIACSPHQRTVHRTSGSRIHDESPSKPRGRSFSSSRGGREHLPRRIGPCVGLVLLDPSK